MFKDFYEQKGIRRQLRIPRTTHQNGVAKRSNLTLLDMVKSIMAERKSIPVTPYELWHGRKPFLAHLRPWSSTGYVHNLTHKHGKHGPRATKMVFIRYPEYSKGYVMYGDTVMVV